MGHLGGLLAVLQRCAGDMRTHQRRKRWDPKRWYVPRKPWWRCCLLLLALVSGAVAVVARTLTA